MAQLGSALDWGSRGRRFKSCHPDGKQQVRGRFGQNPRRPLCCRVAIGVAMAHILSCPLLLRADGRQSVPWLERGLLCTSPVTATEQCPSSSETVYSAAPAASMCVAREFLSMCRADAAYAQILGHGADRPQCAPGVDCCPRMRRLWASHLSWTSTRVGHCSTIDKWTGPTERTTCGIAMVLRLPGRTRLSRTPARFELFPIPRADPGAAFALSAIHQQLDVCSPSSRSPRAM